MGEDQKIDEVAKRIREIESKANPVPSADSDEPMQASRMGMDFGFSILGGALLGWLVDMVLPRYAPWPLVVMIFAGFSGGLWNMWRSLNGKQGLK